MSERLVYGDTWIDPEEYAYPSGSLRQSRRHFAARCPDGIIRRGVCGIPDTFFSLPARLKARGRTVAGFVGIDTDHNELTFTPYRYRKNHTVFTPRPQHDGPLPHGIGCPECRDARVCNECGRAWEPFWQHCTNGRCLACCESVCKHRTA